jgi:hypothetical protein
MRGRAVALHARRRDILPDDPLRDIAVGRHAPSRRTCPGLGTVDMKDDKEMPGMSKSFALIVASSGYRGGGWTWCDNCS